MRRLLATLALALLTPFGVVAFAPAAHADITCTGTLIARKATYVDGVAVGEITVYWDGSTYNCARFNHLGPSYGVYAYTDVYLNKCTSTHKSQGCPLDPIYYSSRSGNFAYYAGPITVPAPNNCVEAHGTIYWKGAYRTAYVGPVGCPA